MIQMDTTVQKGWLLDVVRKNREQHAGCYQESVDGYVEHAKAKLTEHLERLKDGKVVTVMVHLSVPSDHTKDYDTVIGMLENNVNDLITLDADMYSKLVDDDWDWTDRWLVANAGYSPSTHALAQTKGVL